MNKRRKPIISKIEVPGDKSISHRALMISSIANGISRIDKFLFSHDSLSTMNCLRNLGVKIECDNDKVFVHGRGLNSFRKYDWILDARNSGTTMRLLSGLLSGSEFESVIDGDASLRNRPMDRLIKPLSLMGLQIYGEKENKFAPIHIYGGNLNPISYEMEVYSAQVKSSILLAGINCEGYTKVYEKVKTRDHTERMIKYFNGNIDINENSVFIKKSDLEARDICVPGDISSASFFMVLAGCIEGSELIIKNVGLNSTRTGIIDVLHKMGVNVELFNIRYSNFEDICDIKVYGSKKLNSITIEGDIIPRLIDEVPIICAIASFADGETIIKDIEELKYKESNRINSIVCEFKKLGIEIYEMNNSIKIIGGKSIKGCKVDSHNDHRIAMALMILSCISGENIEIYNKSCVDISFPEFYDILDEVLK